MKLFVVSVPLNHKNVTAFDRLHHKLEAFLPKVCMFNTFEKILKTYKIRASMLNLVYIYRLLLTYNLQNYENLKNFSGFHSFDPSKKFKLEKLDPCTVSSMMLCLYYSLSISKTVSRKIL